MHSRWARVARGSAGAAVATLVAALSHTLAGDAPSSWFGVAASFLLAASAGSVLAGRSVSWVRLTASVAVGQGLFHFLFASMGTPVPAVHHHAAEVAMAGSHPHGMLWAHVLAGAVTVVALRFGESAFWALTDVFRFALRWIELTRSPVVVRVMGRSEPPVLRGLGLPRRIPSRGPPSVFA